MVASLQQRVHEQVIGLDGSGRDEDLIGVDVVVGVRQVGAQPGRTARFVVPKPQFEQSVFDGTPIIRREKIEQLARGERVDAAFRDVEFGHGFPCAHPSFERKCFDLHPLRPPTQRNATAIAYPPDLPK